MQNKIVPKEKIFLKMKTGRILIANIGTKVVVWVNLQKNTT